MENYTYSPSVNAFYANALKADYDNSGSWPVDGVSVSDSIFIEYSALPQPGKIRVAGIDGYPMWADAPSPTHDEQVVIAETKKQQLIDDANKFMSSKQWPGKAAIGRLQGDELVQYNLWLDYLDALEAVDTSSAPDIEWPTPPVLPAR